VTAPTVCWCLTSIPTATTSPAFDRCTCRPPSDLHGLEPGPGREVRGLCSLQGSFIPFARTKVERLATGDPRPSIEERYPTPEAYVATVRRAAEQLVAQRYLLADDAIQLIAQAEREGVRVAP
jgi:hypothetical protein